VRWTSASQDAGTSREQSWLFGAAGDDCLPCATLHLGPEPPTTPITEAETYLQNADHAEATVEDQEVNEIGA
jgi:hypothetical protein